MDEEIKEEESTSYGSIKGESKEEPLLLEEETASSEEPADQIEDTEDKVFYKVHICGEVYE